MISVRTNLDTTPLDDVITDPAAILHGMLSVVGLLPEGTNEGRASVGMLITLDDGRQVVAEATWREFRTAARALNACPLGEAENRADGIFS